ncbi:MAG: hypothetical protein HY820_00630 [Acidobacteria bacterium]|nr:hypothetical protein [Acidobacteriota bacterium]
MPDSVALAAAILVLYSHVLVEGLLLRAMWQRARRGTLRFGAGLETAWRWMAATPVRAMAAAALVVWIGRLALLPVLPPRAPRVTDEFAYLLAADTFAHGRLVNPAPRLWQHFEAPHVIVTPVYAGMYLPGQGAVLAVGQLLGHPWIGVWLVTGVMAGAMVWALQGWLPPRWAALAGVVLAVRLGWFSYWMNSYWGASFAALGGAIAVGAAGRLRKRARWRDAFLLGFGLVVVMYTRAYEGLFLGLGLTAILLPRFHVRLLASGAIVIAGAAGLMYYFSVVTGSPFKPPEVVQREPYAMGGVFFWEEVRPNPGYRHKTMEDFYSRWEVKSFSEVRSVTGFLWNRLRHALSVWLFYLGPLLSVPLFFAARVVRDRRVRPLVIAGAIAVTGSLLSVWFYAHYLAPACAILYVLVFQGMRHLAVWRRQTRAGWQLVRGLAAVCLVMAGVKLVALPVAVLNPPDWPMTWYSSSLGNTARADVLRQLEAQPGKHLALIRYGQRDAVYSVGNEWVYNGADLDGARVVLAREMDEESNRMLIQEYAGRRVWLVEADTLPPRLTPYPR